ncbi:E3 ubiquitin-protein ligase RNF14 [Lates calcarifer]|uniref:RBR-type E3 ubiquitin transferase n=1 Tax=Lates calcarifer TaxID=8187 RepID=A0A4W6FAC1_LATCA|nr:E3 ubiquitin-protein ligase RNF14 [Lates calcarifer]
MNADMEEQEDELLALQSIFDSEEFVRKESNPAGEIRVSVELPADFSVSLTEGETVRQYEISFLPPLLLAFELPEDYPSSSPPSFTLTCSWLTHSQLSALGAQLTELYQATGGAVVLFSWVQFLKEDALKFLDIHALLELPSDEHSNQHSNQDSQNAAHQNDLPSHHSKVNQDGLNSGPSSDSNQTAQASDAREGEQTLQTSEFKADSQDDPSSAAGISKHLPFPESDQTGNASASLFPPSDSSGELDQSGQGAGPLPVHPREKEQTLSGLSLTPSQILLSQLLIYNAAQKQNVFSTTVFDCGVCFTGWLGSECVQLSECGHIFCQACVAEFCKLQITEGDVRDVTCPQADCMASPTPAQVRSLVGEELFSRYDRLLLQSSLDLMPDVMYCPRHTCGSPVILEGSSTAALCSVCGFAFCVTCRKTYHGADNCQAKKNMKEQTEIDLHQDYADLPQSLEGRKALWDDYTSGSKKRRHLLQSRYGRMNIQGTVVDSLSEDWINVNSKHCPHCFCRIQKDGGCNVMTCSQCRQCFCWFCLARLQRRDTHSHFLDSQCPMHQY